MSTKAALKPGDPAGGLYERDNYSWALKQARGLRERRSEWLDWDNLAEEVEDLARRHADALISYLARILQHLWKLAHWTQMRQRNERIWLAEIDAYRERANRLLVKNPGLKASLAEIVADAWADARLELAKDAAAASAKSKRFADLADKRAYPAVCPWTLEQALDGNFRPAAKA
jgi:hypothetical protein